MKKKTFFYKFEKNKHKVNASSHTFFDSDEERKIHNLMGILERKTHVEQVVESIDEKVSNYYKERINKKKEFIGTAPTKV